MRQWGAPLIPADDKEQVCLIRIRYTFTPSVEGGGDEEPGNKEKLQLFAIFLSFLTFCVFSLEKKESSQKRGNEDEFQRNGKCPTVSGWAQQLWTWDHKCCKTCSGNIYSSDMSFCGILHREFLAFANGMLKPSHVIKPHVRLFTAFKC